MFKVTRSLNIGCESFFYFESPQFYCNNLLDATVYLKKNLTKLKKIFGILFIQAVDLKISSWTLTLGRIGIGSVTV